MQRHREVGEFRLFDEIEGIRIDHPGQGWKLDARDALPAEIFVTQDSFGKRIVEPPQVAMVGVGEVLGEADGALVRVWVYVRVIFS